ncbi:hypothetical protein LSH36_245g03017 [Paralvinella palmiformis]|uniref:Uncharacterized protein n=1 Tax=Paralvinella palmiformis TaxID=53620 RepID=A0AAD9N3D6_9ANNE|nr:hypothetical protein LSH36_245g03017 [Paralvinella palmiformis]
MYQILYEELTDTAFGKQTLTGLQLCAMSLPKDEQGFRHVEQDVRLAIHGLRVQELKRSREKKLSAKSEAKAKHDLHSTINALKSEQQMEMSADVKRN